MGPAWGDRGGVRKQPGKRVGTGELPSRSPGVLE